MAEVKETKEERARRLNRERQKRFVERIGVEEYRRRKREEYARRMQRLKGGADGRDNI